jgi:hypothetical protein
MMEKATNASRILVGNTLGERSVRIQNRMLLDSIKIDSIEIRFEDITASGTLFNGGLWY